MADIRGSLTRIRFCSSPCQVFQRNAEWPQLVRVGFFCHGSSRWDRPCKAGGGSWRHLFDMAAYPFAHSLPALLRGFVPAALVILKYDLGGHGWRYSESARNCFSAMRIDDAHFDAALRTENTEGAELPVSFKRVRHQALVRHRVHCVVRFDQKGLVALDLQRR